MLVKVGDSMAAKSAKQQQAANDYLREKVDRVVIYVPKGQKTGLQDAAAAAGVSVNRYIVDAVQARLDKPQERAGK